MLELVVKLLLDLAELLGRQCAEIDYQALALLLSGDIEIPTGLSFWSTRHFVNESLEEWNSTLMAVFTDVPRPSALRVRGC